MSDKFTELFGLNVNEHVEKKKSGNTELSYLSWSWAWAEFKKAYPDATFTVKKDEQNRPYFGDDDIGYMCYTEVTAGGLTYEMWLPVMDGANKAMKREPYDYQTRFGVKHCEAMTMFDVNKTIMRCLVKNLAMFGLGLYIYSGEDLPEEPPKPVYNCSVCGKEIKGVKKQDGSFVTPETVYSTCDKMCVRCYQEAMKPKEETA